MTAVAHDIERASEAVRAANHSTARGVLDGPESYTAVGNLAELVSRLPQVVSFLSRSLHRADPARHFDDRGRDAGSALDAARSHLDDAHGLVDLLFDQLNAAHNHLGHIGRRCSED